MEKAISQEERIKRAEEIYNRRKYANKTNISTSNSSVSGYFAFSVGGLSVVSNDSTTYNSYLLNKTKCKISNIVITPTSGSTIKNIKITGKKFVV